MQTLRERLVLIRYVQILFSDDIYEERAKLENFSVKQKPMGSKNFSVYGRGNLLEHNLLKCWICSSQYHGAGLWPKGDRPKHATLEGQWRTDTTDKSVIERIQDDDASCVIKSTFVSEEQALPANSMRFNLSCATRIPSQV